VFATLLETSERDQMRKGIRKAGEQGRIAPGLGTSRLLLLLVRSLRSLSVSSGRRGKERKEGTPIRLRKRRVATVRDPVRACCGPLLSPLQALIYDSIIRAWVTSSFVSLCSFFFFYPVCE
jgi:hypothetical protein